MTDWVGHALKNHMTSLEQWEGDSATRFRALVRRHSIAVPQTFHLATPTFFGSSGRSRVDFVATHPSVPFSRIFVNFKAGRRLQLIPAAGHATQSGPHAWKMGSRENRRNALGSRCKAHFLQGTRDKNSQLVDRGSCSDRGHS